MTTGSIPEPYRVKMDQRVALMPKRRSKVFQVARGIEDSLVTSGIDGSMDRSNPGDGFE